MNPLCCICEQPASFVCRHDECEESPYICAGPCIKGASQKIHTHNKVKNMIPIEQFLTTVSGIADDNVLTQYIHKLKKRVQILKDSFNSEMDKIVDQHEHDLKVELRIKITKQASILTQKISTDIKGEKFSGKEINDLMNKEKVFENNLQQLHAAEYIKQELKRGLAQLQKFKESLCFISYKERVERSKLLYNEAWKLKNEKKYEEALVKFIKLQQFNGFDFLVPFQIGYCLAELDREDEALVSYMKCLELNPTDSMTYHNIGVIYGNDEQYQQSIKWHTKAIEIDNYFESIVKRAEKYHQMKKFKEAKKDYQLANELQPSQQYQFKILQVEVAQQMQRQNK